jgi:pilus assembly protein CpaF
MSKVELPLHALRAQISSAIDVVVQMSRHVGGRRMLTHITEIDPLSDDGRYQLRDIFTMQIDPNDKKNVQLTWTGQRSNFADQLRPAERAIITDRTRKVFAAER